MKVVSDAEFTNNLTVGGHLQVNGTHNITAGKPALDMHEDFIINPATANTYGSTVLSVAQTEMYTNISQVSFINQGFPGIINLSASTPFPPAGCMITSRDGINYVMQGEEFEYIVRPQDGITASTRTELGRFNLESDANSSITTGIFVEIFQGEIRIKAGSSSVQILSTTVCTYSNGNWYRIKIKVVPGSVECTVYNANGTVRGTGSVFSTWFYTTFAVPLMRVRHSHISSGSSSFYLDSFRYTIPNITIRG